MRRRKIARWLAALAAIPTAVLAAGTASAVNSVVQDSLVPTSVTENVATTATLRVHTTKTCLSFDALTVAVRDANGNQFDFPGAATNGQICKTGYTYTSGARTFPAGTYTMFGSYRVGSTWTELPHQTLTVNPAPPADPTPAGIPGSWNLIFRDEFDGSSLDTNKWTPGWFGTGITNPVSNNELQCYDSNNVSVSGGLLHLQAEARTATCPNGSTKNYVSGLVSSNGKFDFTYGAVEFRVNVPADGSGNIANFPAMWTDGQNWPTDGEIDVWEGLGGNASWHVHNPQGGPGGQTGPTVGWHTFGAEWRPGFVDFYYDGVFMGTLAHSPSSPNYLIMNQAIGFAGGTTVVPADLQVDYVRVWQH